jgi:hypothetical protein
MSRTTGRETAVAGHGKEEEEEEDGQESQRRLLFLLFDDDGSVGKTDAERRGHSEKRQVIKTIQPARNAVTIRRLLGSKR